MAPVDVEVLLALGPFGSAIRSSEPAARRVARGPFRTVRRAAFAGVVVLPLACASYEARPLVPEQELASLQDVRLDRLRVDYATMESIPECERRRVDPLDGFDEAELAAIAISLNPTLRARRAEIGEAQALLVSAGLLPNPDVGAFFRPGIDGASGTSVGLDLLFELLRPGERSARRALADAEVELARAEVAAEESRLVSQVRRARIQVLSAAQSARLLQQELRLRDEAVELVQRQRALGEVNELALAVVELDRTSLQRESRSADARVAGERAELNALLGLPPTLDVALVGNGADLAFTIAPDVPDEELDRRLLTGATALVARRAAYGRAENGLRLAVAGQYPRIAIGPSYEKDVEGSQSLGLGLSIQLPIFDRGQGPIAEKLAERERARAQYAATLHELRAQAYLARSAQRSARAEVEAQQVDVLPLVARTEALFEGALRAREVSVFDWLNARSRAIQARRDLLDALARYATACVDLDAATGTPLVAVLAEIPGAEPTP